MQITGSSFDPDVVFLSDYETAVAQAIHDNTEAEKHFEGGRRDWLDNAAILKSRGLPQRPKPYPALAKKVEVDFLKRTYTITHGPELVGDPNFDLPPDPLPPTGGVARVGPPWTGIPNVYRVLEGDTLQPGQVTPHEGRLLVRKHSDPPYVSDWYQPAPVKK